MQNDLSDYRNKIESALEVHTFNRDVDEVKERLTEKVGSAIESLLYEQLWSQVLCLFFVDIYITCVVSWAY